MLSLINEFWVLIRKVPIGWQFWMLGLASVNVASIFFLNHIEAVAALVAIMLAFFTGIVLFKVQGYTRLIGLVHWPWLLLIPYLFTRIEMVTFSNPFGIWLYTLLVFNSISLILDAVDVAKYSFGDHKPVAE